jgi:hypothetical protein
MQNPLVLVTEPWTRDNITCFILPPTFILNILCFDNYLISYARMFLDIQAESYRISVYSFSKYCCFNEVQENKFVPLFLTSSTIYYVM